MVDLRECDDGVELPVKAQPGAGQNAIRGEQNGMLKVSVTQCRGISPSGEIIEIDPDNALHRSFSKRDLEGVPEVGVYLVCEPHRKLVTEGVEDPSNPQIKSTRRQSYHLQLDVIAAEAPMMFSGHQVLVRDGKVEIALD